MSGGKGEGEELEFGFCFDVSTSLKGKVSCNLTADD